MRTREIKTDGTLRSDRMAKYNQLLPGPMQYNWGLTKNGGPPFPKKAKADWS